MKKIIPGILCCLFLSSCTPARVVLDSRYVPSPPDTPEYGAPAPKTKTVKEEKVACTIATSVEDARSAEDAANGFGWDHVESQDFITWIRSGIASLKSPYYQLATEDSPSETASNTALRLAVKLRKMYIISVTSSKSAIIVLSLDLSDSSGRTLSQFNVRGTDVSVNWAGGEGETKAAFHRSFEQALSKIDAHLGSQCKLAAGAGLTASHGQSTAAAATAEQ